MRARNVILVFRKDWREIRRNWQVLLPIVVIPFLLTILLPTLIFVIPSMSPMPESSFEDFYIIIQNLPSQVQNELMNMTAQQVLVYVMSLYFFAPFFLIIPIMASSVLASDSFAGEKERKTVEALLATPLSDSELFLGKVLVSFFPSMIVTVISFMIYTAIVDFISFNLFDGRLLLPNLVWIMLIFGVAPTVALAVIGLTILISARVKGVREAQQISVILIIPIMILIFGQVSGAIIFGPVIVGVLIGIFILMDVIVIYFGVRLFRREEILLKL